MVYDIVKPESIVNRVTRNIAYEVDKLIIEAMSQLGYSTIDFITMAREERLLRNQHIINPNVIVDSYYIDGKLVFEVASSTTISFDDYKAVCNVELHMYKEVKKHD